MLPLDRSDVQLASLRALAQAQLTDGILPFWERHAFDADGNLRGVVTRDLEYRDGPRHSVVAARILWAFAAAAEALPERRERYLTTARLALGTLVDRMWDPRYGGVYWATAGDGAVLDDRKQVYAQAFAILALARWSRVAGDDEALDRALWLARALEAAALDEERGGYAEALARDWTPTDRTALSDADPTVPRTTNTQIHVFEALTELLRASGDARVAASLTALLRTFLNNVVRAEPFPHAAVYFDRRWRPLSDAVTYGHDLEASWLVQEAWREIAAAGIADAGLERRARRVALDLAEAVRERALEADGAVPYLGDHTGAVDRERHWWTQAEGVVGWLAAYELGGRREDRAAAIRAWDFIERHLVDREHGDWHARLDPDNRVMTEGAGDVKMGPWRDPYHNVRACLEVMRRIG
ncbi:AGE family epimerase/isomerase [Demequina pelophila]|uniref:AGE family epimerase/isomerase n=1 Tax=Demequina pelophila TaxID=1638984 RepID=UPI0007837B7F|nr:AGE family epimerase/isomerase [Demequina pelophila]